MDPASVSRVLDLLAPALAGKGYSFNSIFREGLSAESIDRICSSYDFFIPDWLRLFYTKIDGDHWSDVGQNALLPIPGFTVNPLAVALETGKEIAHFREQFPATAVPFCFISAESYMEHFFIDLHEYEINGSGLVYGFGPGFLTEKFEISVLFDNYISCFEIMAYSIEAGISPCRVPWTEDESARFTRLAASRTTYEDNFWKALASLLEARRQAPTHS